MFLRDHSPDLIEDLSRGLYLVTTRCSCDYLAELFAFDEIAVRMRLGAQVQNRLTLDFEYWRVKDDDEELVARGEQQVACMRKEGDRLTPTPVPESLQAALRQYAEA